MKRTLAVLVAAVVLAGCTGGSSHPVAPVASSPPVATTPPAVVPNPAVEIRVGNHRETVIPVDGIDVRQIHTAAGPAGFYWALPQPLDWRPGGGIPAPTTPAVIHYTLYDQGRPMNEPGRNDAVYTLPLKDVAGTGAAPGGLVLVGLEFHWPWLFIKYNGIVPGGARAAYTGLLAWDVRTPERPHRFLFRGHEAGGYVLYWAASSDYVVWVQDYICNAGWPGTCRAASVYDLNTGRRQALALPTDQVIRDLSIDGAQLRYTAGGSAHSLTLPAPGSAPLPAAAFGEVTFGGFGGTVYLPAWLPPEPFYRIDCTVSADHYRVDFQGSDAPVPVNATPEEAAYTGSSPSLAQMLGSVEAFVGAAPPAGARKDPLPAGETFAFRRGARTLEGHFVMTGRLLSMTWWQDGSWRYVLTDQGIGWQSSEDPSLQTMLAEILAKLPPEGGPVPGVEGGTVEVSVAGDHTATAVWFPLNGEWIHLGGYKYDALVGARDLIPVR